jgi:hypothetical protein
MKTKKKKAKKAADAIPLAPAVKNHPVANTRIADAKLFQMKILYIFPHPGDESFGPAGAIHSQVNGGHEMHRLILTRGGVSFYYDQLNSYRAIKNCYFLGFLNSSGNGCFLKKALALAVSILK